MAAELSTKLRLAAVLTDAGLKDLAAAAAEGHFDDFESDSATPIGDLVHALHRAGRQDLAHRAMAGEWDATQQEAERWAAQQTGPIAGLLRSMKS